MKHDDRIDALSQGVQWFIDSLAQSAFKSQAMRKNDEWKAMMNAFENEPTAATDALALGHSFKQLSSITTTGVWEW